MQSGNNNLSRASVISVLSGDLCPGWCDVILTRVISSATLTIIGILAAVILGTAVLSTAILVKKW